MALIDSGFELSIFRLSYAEFLIPPPPPEMCTGGPWISQRYAINHRNGAVESCLRSRFPRVPVHRNRASQATQMAYKSWSDRGACIQTDRHISRVVLISIQLQLRRRVHDRDVAFSTPRTKKRSFVSAMRHAGLVRAKSML